MKIHNIFENYEPEEDNYTVVDIDHIRRPRITLFHLNKLRKVRNIEKVEKEQRVKDAARIYGAPSDDGGPPGL